MFGNVGKYVTYVGLDNFYLEYELKVQARNEHGSGPNSSVEIIFSAEGSKFIFCLQHSCSVQHDKTPHLSRSVPFNTFGDNWMGH